AAPALALGPLEQEDTRRLLALLADRVNLTLAPDQVRILGEVVAGYPPAAYHAVQMSKRYGLDLVMQDKAALVGRHRTAAMVHHLESLDLKHHEREALRILGTYSPLPLKVLQAALGPTSLPELTDAVMRLIDLSLVILTEDGHYG